MKWRTGLYRKMDRGHDDGDGADEDPFAQLRQVLEQRHGGTSALDFAGLMAVEARRGRARLRYGVEPFSGITMAPSSQLQHRLATAWARSLAPGPLADPRRRHRQRRPPPLRAGLQVRACPAGASAPDVTNEANFRGLVKSQRVGCQGWRSRVRQRSPLEASYPGQGRPRRDCPCTPCPCTPCSPWRTPRSRMQFPRTDCPLSAAGRLRGEPRWRLPVPHAAPASRAARASGQGATELFPQAPMCAARLSQDVTELFLEARSVLAQFRHPAARRPGRFG